jgi:hypothetical protein
MAGARAAVAPCARTIGETATAHQAGANRGDADNARLARDRRPPPAMRHAHCMIVERHCMAL